MVNNNNVQNVKFLRNGVVFTPSNDKTARQVALDAMNEQLNSLADGTAILGRYKETDGVVKTLVGFAYISNDAKTLTVFDVDGAGADVDKKIKTAIEALDSNATSVDGKNVQVKVTETDGKITAVNITTDNTVNSGDVANAIATEIDKLEYSDTAVDGEYVSQVSETDGKIAVKRVALPTVNAISAAGKPITAVSENLGAISATAGTINAEFVNIADSGQKFTATTVEDALAEIAAEIDAMDLTVVSGDGEVITAVSEEDGKVSASKTAIKDVKLTGYAKNTAATGAISGNDDIEDALSKLENNIAASQSATTVTNTDHSINVTAAATGTTIGVNINSGEKVISLGNDGIYTDIKLSAVTVSEANVKEAFALIASDGATQLGSTIKIYKDSSLLSVALLHADYSDPQNPVLPTYDKINGWTDIASPTQANQALCFAYENVEGNVVVAAVPVGSFINEQEFASGLTWDSTAGKVIGVVDPSSESFLTVGTNGFKVDGIKGEIDTKINALDATVGSTNVESGKHVAVQVVEDAGKLTALTVTENDIASKSLLDGLSGKTVTEAASSNDSITVTPSAATDGTKHLDIITDASKIKMSGFTKADALTKITDSSSVTDALLEVDKVITEKAEVISTALNGLEATKAEKTALDAEIAARKDVDGQSGDKYAANANVNYIGNATSLNDADIKLDIALKAVDDAMLTGVAAGDGITVSVKNNKSQIIDVKINNDGGIVNDGTGLHLGTVDCGTY